MSDSIQDWLVQQGFTIDEQNGYFRKYTLTGALTKIPFAAIAKTGDLKLFKALAVKEKWMVEHAPPATLASYLSSTWVSYKLPAHDCTLDLPGALDDYWSLPQLPMVMHWTGLLVRQGPRSLITDTLLYLAHRIPPRELALRQHRMREAHLGKDLMAAVMEWIHMTACARCACAPSDTRWRAELRTHTLRYLPPATQDSATITPEMLGPDLPAEKREAYTRGYALVQALEDWMHQGGTLQKNPDGTWAYLRDMQSRIVLY